MRAWEEGWSGSGGDARGVEGASVAMKVAYHAAPDHLAGCSFRRKSHMGAQPREIGPAGISHHLTVEARNRPATSLRSLAVLNVGFKNVGARHAVPEGAERRALY